MVLSRGFLGKYNRRETDSKDHRYIKMIIGMVFYFYSHNILYNVCIKKIYIYNIITLCVVGDA